jgi:hypothetical protein
MLNVDADPKQLLAHLRPVLERLGPATGSDIFTPGAFHPSCTTLGIAHSLRAVLWWMPVQHGCMTDAGNDAVRIIELVLQFVAAPRGQVRSAAGSNKG